jgi:hypothetical protein
MLKSENGGVVSPILKGIEHPPLGIVTVVGTVIEIGLLDTITEYFDRAV